MSLQPGNADKWIKEGISHYNAKRYQECLGACEKAIQLDPACARAYHGKGLVLAQQRRYEEAITAYQKASYLAPEKAKIHVDMAELLYIMVDYEKSGLSYRRAIKLDSQFEAVYLDKLKMLLEQAFKWIKSPMRDLVISTFRDVLLFNPNNAIALAEIAEIQKERRLDLVQYGKDMAARAEQEFARGDYGTSGSTYRRAIKLDNQFEAAYLDKLKMLLEQAFKWIKSPTLDSAISSFHKVLLFNPDNAIALAEIAKLQEKKQREVEGLRSCPERYSGTVIFTECSNSLFVNLCSYQLNEEARIFLVENNSDNLVYIEDSLKYFNKTAEGWRISFPLPLLETNFRVEVLRDGVVIAYGYYYWINKGYLGRRTECNIYLTIAYKPEGKSSEEESNDKDSKSIIYVPDRTGGRNRRVRRGS